MLLTEKQLELVDKQIKKLIKTDSFYGKKYRELGIKGCKSQEDFDKIPSHCRSHTPWHNWDSSGGKVGYANPELSSFG